MATVKQVRPAINRAMFEYWYTFKPGPMPNVVVLLPGASDWEWTWTTDLTPAEDDIFEDLRDAADYVHPPEPEEVVVPALADLEAVVSFMEGSGGGVAQIRTALRALMRLAFR